MEMTAAIRKNAPVIPAGRRSAVKDGEENEDEREPDVTQTRKLDPVIRQFGEDQVHHRDEQYPCGGWDGSTHGWLTFSRHSSMPWLSRLLGDVPLIQSLPHQRFDNRLPADVEVLGGFVELIQHGGSEIHVHTLDGLNHTALASEITGHVLSLFGQSCNRIGRGRTVRFRNSLHTDGSPLSSTSTG